jgi:hypothetical protein
LAVTAAVWLSCVAVLCPACVPAGAAADQPYLDKEAKARLGEMISYLEKQKVFAFRAYTTYDEILSDDTTVEYGLVVDALVERPNRLRLHLDGKRRDQIFFYDRDDLTLYDKWTNTFVSAPAPGNLDDMLAQVDEKYGLSLPLTDLIGLGNYQDLLKRAEYLVRVEANPLDDTVHMDQFLLRTPYRDVQFWIQGGKEPLLRKLVVTYRDQPGWPQFRAVFTRWDTTPKPSAGEFFFIPPSGAVRAEFLPRTDKAN